ncbi:MAG TPA: MotA/TolQ/ExbB proton channel family protein [Bacteroidales bacterium]|nr:MotA/TolQ/ExbB proton channel family protein [Bacteroidales bacterium]
MKKLIGLLIAFGMLTITTSSSLFAQNKGKQEKTQTETAVKADTTATSQLNDTAKTTLTDMQAAPTTEETKTFHQILKEKFIEGGPGFMATILLCLIFGLAFAIERIIYLNLSTTNTKKLLTKVEDALNNEGIDAAKEVCKNTRGPVAGIFYEGLNRYDENLEMVEKSIISYGGVLTSSMEKNLSWISLFIAIAPMLGFLGTVVGMVEAFDNIAKAGDISPQIVATGIKIALLTTLFGLIVAIILQLFYNYILSKIDNLIHAMEESSINFMDILVKYSLKKSTN